MAYNQENLTIMTNNVKSGVVPAVYAYWNEDDDTMTGAGLLVDNRLVVGDQVWVIADDYTAQVLYNVASVSSGAATLQASTTPA